MPEAPNKLSDQEVAERLRELREWAVRDSKLTKAFKFKDFSSAIDFVNSIAKVAEAQGHHPDLFVTWGEVDVFLTSHSAGRDYRERLQARGANRPALSRLGERHCSPRVAASQIGSRNRQTQCGDGRRGGPCKERQGHYAPNSAALGLARGRASHRSFLGTRSRILKRSSAFMTGHRPFFMQCERVSLTLEAWIPLRRALSDRLGSLVARAARSATHAGSPRSR